MELRKTRIPATAVRKCLNRLFGFSLPYKSWEELAKAFPHENLSSRGVSKLFLRQYVWTHCHKHLVGKYCNPFRKSDGKRKIPSLLSKRQ